MSPITVVVLAAVVAVVARQHIPRVIRRPLLAVGPLLLAFLAVGPLLADPPAGALGLALFAIELVAGVPLGVARGRSLRLWRDAARRPWRLGTRETLRLWAATLALGVALIAVAELAGGEAEASERGGFYLYLALTFAAQNAVVARRFARGAIGEPPADA